MKTRQEEHKYKRTTRSGASRARAGARQTLQIPGRQRRDHETSGIAEVYEASKREMSTFQLGKCTFACSSPGDAKAIAPKSAMFLESLGTVTKKQKSLQHIDFIEK